MKGNYKLMMRIGNDLQVNKQLDQIKWFGRGPGESYWGRKTASLWRLQSNYRWAILRMPDHRKAKTNRQQTGMQGIDSWGAWPLKKYQIPFANQEYSYWIKPIR